MSYLTTSCKRMNEAEGAYVFWFNITGKIISPSFIQEPLKEEKSKSTSNKLLPHSTAGEGGNCLKN